MLSVLQVLGGLTGLFILLHVYRFIRNYVAASRSGLPVLVYPIDQNNLLWVVISVASRPWMRRNLPAFVWNRLKYGIYGWEFQEKLKPFHGENTSKVNSSPGERSFFLSGAGKLELWTVDASVGQQIALHPDEFQQPTVTELFLNLFGPNVLSANGKVWARHRRIVASAVTERISPVVWTASVTQTQAVINEICAGSNGESGATARFFDMLKSVTINVLSKAGMGVDKEWTTKPSNDKDEAELSYMDSIKSVNEFMSGPLIIPTAALLRWPSWLPGQKSLRRLGRAKVLFPIRTKELLNDEKQRIARNGNDIESKNNLLSSLVAASNMGEDEHDAEKQSGKKSRPALSDDELTGNLFIFTAAGYDTTAGTLTYATVLLMRYPKWQDWLAEEVDSIRQSMSEVDNGGNSEYQAVFPQCTRLLAFMFETLRLFPVIFHLIKENKHATTVTTESGRSVVIPANTTTYVNFVGLHLDPKVWRDLNLTPGDTKISADWEDEMPGRNAAIAPDYKVGGGKLGDEWRFRPTRWIKADGTSTNKGGNETLFQPPRGTFMPWSIGPRVCPGSRMAQVEFVAILFTMLSNYRIEAVAEHQESPAAVNARLEQMMQNSSPKLALEMDVFNKSDEKVQSRKEKTSNGIKVRLVRR